MSAEFDKQLAEDIETEFFGDVYARCSVENMGETAGHKSASYDLGSTSNPLAIFSASQTVAHKSAAVDAVAAAAAVEQPGGWGCLTSLSPCAWGFRIQTSELKKANESGDATADPQGRDQHRYARGPDGVHVEPDQCCPADRWRR